MSQRTNIEWCDSTGNPWIGCTKISPGCARCYAAELDANRFSRTMSGGTKENPVSHWGKGAPRVRTKAFWSDALKWNLRAGSCDKRPRIFPSLCDIWDSEVPIEWLADYLQLVFQTQNLDHLILTKRPEQCLDRLFLARDKCFYGARPWIQEWLDGKPPSNVWLGVSVEDQQRADERIPLLLQIPAKVRFLSVEPLLEPVVLKLWDGNGRIDWGIVGGESGLNRRDCGVEALVDAAEQFVRDGVPCFFKQDSAAKPGQRGRIPDHIWELKQFPAPHSEAH